MKFRKTDTSKAFTLVETMLAIAILAVVLTAIGGALFAALETSRENDRDTLVVSMADDLLSELRLLPLDALGGADLPAPGTAAPAMLTVSSAPEDSVFYFNGDGRRVPLARREAEGIYRCTVKKTPVPVGYQTGRPDSRCELLQLSLVFQWPVSGTGSGMNTQVISARLARR